MEGPRAVQESEIETLRTMANRVFRGDSGRDMTAEYPQLFNADNYENLRVCVDEGRCVSHVGMTERWASLFGCQIQVCCIGAVSTLPEYRKQGLASACFDDAVEKAFRDGVDWMIVSGNRNLYRQRGCLRVGRDTAFGITAETLPAVVATARHSVTVDPMTDDELPLVMDCYRQEPVRFLRPLDDYRFALQSRFVMNSPAEFLVVREAGDFRGYVILQRPDGAKTTHILEFAGDRHALFAALPEIFRRYNLIALGWQVQRQDALFRSLCERASLPGELSPTSGTVKLINYPQLMERLRPYWEERLGRREAAKLAFRQEGEEYGLRFGAEEWGGDRDTMTRLLFGAGDGLEQQALAGKDRLTKVVDAILPLPGLWYGINYV